MEIKAPATAVMSGDRRALARAITLIESGRDDHRAQTAEQLALLSAGMDKTWQAINTTVDWRRNQEITAAMCADQARAAFHEEVAALLLARIRTGPALAERMAARKNDVAPGRLAPSSAALLAITRTKGGIS